MEQTSHVSLYEYLGRRAGLELGKKVWETAKKQRIKPQIKQVNQGGYKGKVMCYPIAFLAGYFSGENAYEVY